MTLLLAHAVATWFMVGLIWTIQVVHYPLFAEVGGSTFTEYEQRHTTRMGALLAVPASLEVVTGGLLVWLGPPALDRGLVFASGLILVILWITTLLVQVPLHRSLSTRRSDAAIGRLVATNWVRTAGWTVRGALVAVMVAQTL